MRIACKLPARTCDCRQLCAYTCTGACTRGRDINSRTHTHTRARAYGQCIYVYTACRGATVSRHYATVTRRVKFARGSRSRPRSSEIYLSRLHMQPHCTRLIHARTRVHYAFHGDDDRVKLAGVAFETHVTFSENLSIAMRPLSLHCYY